jgi:hypothetical protein
MSTTWVTRIPPPANAGVEVKKQNELSGNSKEKLLQAAEFMEGGMCWEDTAEGFEFWSAVCERLRNIAGGEPLS